MLGMHFSKVLIKGLQPQLLLQKHQGFLQNHNCSHICCFCISFPPQCLSRSQFTIIHLKIIMSLKCISQKSKNALLFVEVNHHSITHVKLIINFTQKNTHINRLIHTLKQPSIQKLIIIH